MEAVLSRLVASRPTVSALWTALKGLPGGPRLFSKTIGWMAPYTSTIDCRVTTLEHGFSQVQLTDRRAVRNHLDCVHAIALMNLGEVSTGLAVLYSIDGRGRGIIRSLKMDYLKKARGTITATTNVAVPTTTGDHNVKAIADLTDEQGVVVARAHAGWKITVT